MLLGPQNDFYTFFFFYGPEHEQKTKYQSAPVTFVNLLSFALCSNPQDSVLQYTSNEGVWRAS